MFHKPRNFFDLKGQISDAEALNAAENMAHQIKDRSITVPEASKALATGRAMNTGKEPAMSMTPAKVFGTTTPKP